MERSIRMRPVIYIFLNHSLGMSSGKLAAQSAHAAAMSVVQSTQEMRSEWEDSHQRTIITLIAKGDSHLSRISTYLQQRNISVIPIIDEGVNEVEPQSWTALATQILDKNNDQIEQTFRSFKSYRDFVKVTLEVER